MPDLPLLEKGHNKIPTWWHSNRKQSTEKHEVSSTRAPEPLHLAFAPSMLSAAPELAHPTILDEDLSSAKLDPLVEFDGFEFSFEELDALCDRECDIERSVQSEVGVHGRKRLSRGTPARPLSAGSIGKKEGAL
jgi:hypothetical protein